jgi:DNA-binding MarR family transcriptional regulator
MKGMCSIDGFCELLHEVSSACARKEAEALAGGGLAVAEFHALAEISRSPRPPLEELAACLSVSRGRVTRIIDGLEAKGLVTRKRDPADQRNVVLEITRQGEKALALASKLRHVAGGSLLASMSPAQRRQLVESLTRLRDFMVAETAPKPAATRRKGRTLSSR